MQFKTSIGFIIFLFFFFSCEQNSITSISPKIIPTPRNIEIQEGDFILDSNTEIIFDATFNISAEYLKGFIAEGSQIQLKEGEGKTTISFKEDASIKNEEGYKLKVSNDKIIISASTDKGAFYAVQTLRQLLPASFENGTFKGNKVAIKCLTIEDEPQFVYRGMHLDVGRHMFSVDFIKKYIDAMAMLKMNTFHWHLTEDQGWRIEIKKYPKLNEIAAFRKETLIGHYSDQPHQFDGKRYGGFYTQEQVKDVVSYAQSRQVTIIPEIEMPGHSQAAISAYPELGCPGHQVEVATKWGVFEAIYCTKDETFEFLENVLDEVIALFPGEYIHIGGDEAPKTQWKYCKACQNRIKQEGLKDEHELQSYFISRIEKYLNSKGKQIIGWDEILEGGLAPNASVMSWRGIDGAVQAAKESHNVILTPGSHCYFDHYQSTNPNEPLAIGGFLPLEKVYSFNPMPDGLTKEEQKYVLGAQGNVWTEYMPTSKKVEYMVFPRILAMSEAVWSRQENKNYDDFIVRLERFHKRFDALDINYANHLYEVEGQLDSEENKLTYTLQTLTKDKEIRYTLDGSDPKVNSEIYKTPFLIEKSSIIKAAIFNSEQQLGNFFTQELNYHKAVGKQVELNVAPHKAYNAGGKDALINSINGSDKRFGDKEWLGFWGEDVEVTIDLGVQTEINEINTRFYNGNGQWIYAPKQVEISFDNEDYRLYTIQSTKDLLVGFNQEFESKKARYIKLKIPNYGVIPEGAQGAGNKAWTFIDEIVIK